MRNAHVSPCRRCAAQSVGWKSSPAPSPNGLFFLALPHEKCVYHIYICLLWCSLSIYICDIYIYTEVEIVMDICNGPHVHIKLWVCETIYVQLWWEPWLAFCSCSWPIHIIKLDPPVDQFSVFMTYMDLFFVLHIFHTYISYISIISRILVVYIYMIYIYDIPIDDP